MHWATLVLTWSAVLARQLSSSSELAHPRVGNIIFEASAARDQGSCQCSAAFAAIGLYEEVLIRRGYNYNLSEQAVLQCADNYNYNNTGLTNDCRGVQPLDALNTLAEFGALNRSEYPYISGNWGANASYEATLGICNVTEKVKLGTASVVTYYNSSIVDLQSIIKSTGPVIASIFPNSAFLAFNGSSVFNECSIVYNTEILSHTVLILGFNS